MIRSAIHRLSPNGVGRKIGYVTMYDTPDGLRFDPDVSSLPSGYHGFHIHEFGDIEPKVKDGKKIAGGMAGSHYDPEATGVHLGPYRNGHLGDLPKLRVDADGTARQSVVAPRLTLDEVKGLALIIHSGSDNYSDYPVVNGGGKSRIAGGVITNDCPYCRKINIKQLSVLALAGLGLYMGMKR